MRTLRCPALCLHQSLAQPAWPAAQGAGPAPRCRVWSAEGLAPLQSIANGGGWVTDCTLLEGHAVKKLAVAAQDRTVGPGAGWQAALMHGRAGWCWEAGRSCLLGA